MNRESLDKLCERGILGLVLAIAVFTPLAFGGLAQNPVGSSWDWVMANPFVLVMGATAAVVALWSVRLWINPRPQLLWPPICWAVVGFAVYGVIRYLTSDIEYVTRQEVLQVLVYTCLFLAIVNNLHRQESVQAIVISLIFLAMAISFYAVYQFATGSDRVWYLHTPYKHQGTGTFISANNLGGFLEMILPLGLAYTLTSRLKAVSKVFTGYASLAILAGVAVTGSRGTWLAAALALVALFVALLFHRAYRLPALVLLITSLGGGIYFGAKDIFLQTRFRELQAPSGELNDDGRFAIWRAAEQLWHENIWWGIGPGHFNSRFGKYRPEIVQRSPDRVHNDYLNTLTDWGIVGMALVAIALALLVAGAFRTWLSLRRNENGLGDQRSSKLAVVLGASIGLIAILAHSLVDFNMHVPANAIVAVMLMAFLTCYVRFATDRYWFKVRLGIRVILTIVLAGAFSYLAWQTVISEKATLWIVRAKREPANSVEQIAALEKAFATDNKWGETARTIGEAYRQQSWEGIGDSEGQARQAMKWFQQAITLNPYDDSSILRYGMCLDRIFDKHDEAFEYFNRAIELDSNSYFNNAYMGWHYVQSGDYAAARPWFLRSYHLEWNENPIADTYLKLVDDRMMEAATNASPLSFR